MGDIELPSYRARLDVSEVCTVLGERQGRYLEGSKGENSGCKDQGCL